MIRPAPHRVLFTGYAPVHFICFRSLYERLVQTPGVELFVSGGLRTKTPDGFEYDAEGLYGRFGVPDERILTLEQIQEQDFDVLFAANSKLIEPRHVARRIQIFHGISFRNRAVRQKNMECDHYFVVGPYMQRRFVEAGLIAEDDPRVVPIGFLKTDRLLDGSLDRAELLARHGFSGRRPVLLYAPTGLAHNSLETMGEEVIQRINETGHFDLVIKLHDHPKKKIDWVERLQLMENDHCRLARDVDVIPLLHMSDLLISDASSVSNEYTLLDRPMIFLDVPRLIEASARGTDSMLEADRGRWTGLTVRQPGNVVPAIERHLRWPGLLSEMRRAQASELFYNPGRATDAAMSWLDEHVLPVGATLPGRLS